MTYQEFNRERQNNLNRLPIRWAFGEEQLDKVLEDWGITRNEMIDKCRPLAGGIYLKSEQPLVDEILSKDEEYRDKLHRLMEEDEDFAVDAFYYEMCNHEYFLDYYEGDYNVCECFGNCEYGDFKDYRDYLSECEYSEKVAQSFRKAMKKHLKEAEENGWY